LEEGKRLFTSCTQLSHSTRPETLTLHRETSDIFPLGLL
jgi:hypothetical protein